MPSTSVANPKPRSLQHSFRFRRRYQTAVQFQRRTARRQQFWRATRHRTGPFHGNGISFQCHADVRGQFSLPSHHPVPEGKFEFRTGLSFAAFGFHLCRMAERRLLAGERQLPALSCRPSTGPYVFEHEALREGCTTCHTAHGSVNAKLLTVRDANLCLKCHFQQQTTGGQLLIGGTDHTYRVQQGTCWTACSSRSRPRLGA